MRRWRGGNDSAVADAPRQFDLCTAGDAPRVRNYTNGRSVRFGRGCNSIYCVAQRTKREAAAAVDADDDALLVHEDSYVGVRRNVPSSQGIADLRYSSKPVRRAAVNLGGNEGIGRRRCLGPTGSAPLEHGGRDGARLRRRHRDRRVGLRTTTTRQRRRAPHTSPGRTRRHTRRGMHRPQVVPHDLCGHRPARQLPSSRRWRGSSAPSSRRSEI